MGDMENQLNTILSDPEAMEKIRALAQSLSGGSGDAPASAPPEAKSTAPDLSGLAALLSGPGGGEAGKGPGLDPRLIQLGARVLQEYNRNDDKNVALLEALKPFLKPERVQKMDRAVQISRLSRVIKAVLAAARENGGMFRV